MATVDESPSAKRWLPLEANPDVMNQVLIFVIPNFIFENFHGRDGFQFWFCLSAFKGTCYCGDVVVLVSVNIFVFFLISFDLRAPIVRNLAMVVS